MNRQSLFFSWLMLDNLFRRPLSVVRVKIFIIIDNKHLLSTVFLRETLQYCFITIIVAYFSVIMWDMEDFNFQLEMSTHRKKIRWSEEVAVHQKSTLTITQYFHG